MHLFFICIININLKVSGRFPAVRHIHIKAFGGKKDGEMNADSELVFDRLVYVVTALELEQSFFGADTPPSFRGKFPTFRGKFQLQCCNPSFEFGFRRLFLFCPPSCIPAVGKRSSKDC